MLGYDDEIGTGATEVNQNYKLQYEEHECEDQISDIREEMIENQRKIRNEY